MKEVQMTEKQKQIIESDPDFLQPLTIEKWKFVIFVVNEKTFESKIAYVSRHLPSAEALFEHTQEVVEKTGKWLGEEYHYAFFAKTEAKTIPSFPKSVYADAKKGVFKPLSVSRLPKGSIIEVDEDDYDIFMPHPDTKQALQNGVIVKKVLKGNK